MQKKTPLKAAILLLAFACTQQENAQDAIKRSRGTLIDQVNATGKGLPYFSKETLNPTWDETSHIVQIPSMNWVDQNGKPQSEALFQGKKSILALMFTSCSGFCPTLVHELKRLEKANAEQKDLQIVLLSVDPEFDSPERLKVFARAHSVDKPNWIFLRAPEAATTAFIRQTLASQVQSRSIEKGRDFVHAGHFYLIDAKGRLRAIMNGTEIAVANESVKTLSRL